MSYPATSDWTSSDQNSGWYLHRVTGQPTVVCSSTGWDSLVDLQGELRTRLSASPLTTYDGNSMDGSTIVTNDPATLPGAPWNVELLKGLYAVAKDARVPLSTLSLIQSDAQRGTGPISPATLQTGLWIGKGYYSGVVRGTTQAAYGVGSPSEVALPAGTIYPSMDTPPPVPTAGVNSGAVCNVAPAGVESVVPVSQVVVPFQFNTLLVFGILAAAAITAVIVSRQVPVTDPEVLRRQRRARRNPFGRRRRRSVR